MNASLDAIGRRFGSSKSSLYRDLLRHYEPLLEPFRGEAFDLLEIGVGDGASLRVWLDYFPNANVVGLDVRRVFLHDGPDRCTLVHGAQDDVTLLLDLARRFRFRLVIDDGSRHGGDQSVAFQTLFPGLEPGGIYACEGVWNETPDIAQSETPNQFLDLVVALGQFAVGRLDLDAAPIDRARFTALARKSGAVMFLPRAVAVTAKGLRP